MKKLTILFVLLSLLIVPSASANEPPPQRMFLPAIPANNGGCNPIVGTPPPAILVDVQDPYITVDILSPCDPISHIMMRTFYQDEAHPMGVWTRWMHISESNFRIYMRVLGRIQTQVGFTSLGPKPYSVEVSVP